jgi:hypothetical protein
MTALSSLYASFIRQQFGDYRPVWLPTTLISPGDILFPDQDGTFQHLGSLSSNESTRGIPLVAREGTAAFQMSFVASKGCSVTTKATGETNLQMPSVPQASAGFGKVGVESSVTTSADAVLTIGPLKTVTPFAIGVRLTSCT